MMTNYKDFNKEYIGDSDNAALILVGCCEKGLKAKVLSFGEDNSYSAYIVDGVDVEIGNHYKEIAEFNNWLKIYDDEGLSKKIEAEYIKVYRAGEMGCIIQKYNQDKSRTKDLNNIKNNEKANEIHKRQSLGRSR